MVATGWFKECGTAHLEDVSSCRVSVHLLWVFQRHCAPFLLFFLPVLFRFATDLCTLVDREKFRYRTKLSRECRAMDDYMTRESRRRLEIIRAYYPNVLPARVLPFATDKLRISPWGLLFKWHISFRRGSAANVGRNSLSEATPRGDPFSRWRPWSIRGSARGEKRVFA